MKSSSLQQNSLAAHGWWLASEVARRHKNLTLSTCVETMGLDETLGLFDTETRLLAFISDEVPNRAVVDGNVSATWAYGWSKILELPPREAITTVERQLQINVPHHALETTEQTLVYRLIAKLIASRVWSGDTWRAFSSSYYDALMKSFVPSDALEEFPSALDKFEARYGRGGVAAGADGFWVIYKNGDGVLALDEEAYVHFPDDRPPVCLMHRFNKLERSIDALTLNCSSQFLTTGV